MRIPRETGRYRVQGRERGEETKEEEALRTLTDRDKHVETEAEGPEHRRDGEVAAEAAGLAAPGRCAVATPRVAGARVCWDVRVHTFVCKRQLMLKQACAGARRKQPWQKDSPSQQPGAAVDFSLAATQSEYHEIPLKIWAAMCPCLRAGRGAHPPPVPSPGPAATCGLQSPWLQTPSRRQGSPRLEENPGVSPQATADTVWWEA